MIAWWDNLGRKGKMYFFGFFDIGVNAVLYPFGIIFPKLLILGIALVFVGFVIPSSWDD